MALSSAQVMGARSGVSTSAHGDLESLAGISLTEAVARIRDGTVTATQLTTACLERIRVYNPKLNAFITVLGEESMVRATQLDLEQKAGKLRGPLHGIPIAVKDNIDSAGVRTTAGSRVYDDRVPKEDAEVVRRLVAAGAILLGKTNLSEFGSGLSYFGPVRNPWNLDRDPSGSSGGSAAAAAANLTFGSLGTDTFGSIRAPAAYCGVVGLKPTYGLVPIRGIVPLMSSLDHCGPLTRTASDAAHLLNVLAGYDNLDIVSVDHPNEDYVAALSQPVDRLRLGVPRAPFFDHLDGDTSRCVEEAIRVLSGVTKETRTVSLPAVGQYHDVFAYEMYAYHRDIFEHQAHRYMVALRQLLSAIQTTLNSRESSCSAKITNYIRGRLDLMRLRLTIDSAFTDVDLVVLPTLRVTPRPLRDAIDSQENPKPRNPNEPCELSGANCPPFNFLGLPAISIPCGFSRDGLPIGLMIAGPRFSEGRIFALANAYEMITGWTNLRPPLTETTPLTPLHSL